MKPASLRSVESEAALVDVANALRRIVQSIRASSHAVETSLGVTGAQVLVLQQLQAHPRASMRELASLTLTDQSSVSVVVGRLVLRRLVTRAPSKDDRRRVELTLTSRGQALLTRAPELARSRLLGSLRRVPAKDLQTLRRVLAVLVEDLGVSAKPAEMFFENPPARPRRKS